METIAFGTESQLNDELDWVATVLDMLREAGTAIDEPAFRSRFHRRRASVNLVGAVLDPEALS